MLCGRRRDVLHFVGEYLNRHGFAPTIREVMEGSGFRSTSAAKYHLDWLHEHGYLVMRPSKARAISLTERAYQTFDGRDGERARDGDAPCRSGESEIGRLQDQIVQLQGDNHRLVLEVIRMKRLIRPTWRRTME